MVIFGGRSVEHEISIITALQAIYAINSQRYHVIPVYITKQGLWYTGQALLAIENYKNMSNLLYQCQPIMLPANTNENTLINHPPRLFQRKIFNQVDIAFPIIHGAHGEDGTLQGLLELNNLPYVGCDVQASAVTMDKVTTKILLKSAGLPVVDDIHFYAGEWSKQREALLTKAENTLAYPMIVKPATSGSTIGITKVNNRQELEEAIELARSISYRVLIEKVIPNLKEINCSVVGDYEQCEASLCEEPIGSAEVLSFEDKYIGGSKSGSSKGMSGAKRKLPAEIPDTLAETIQTTAKQAFYTLNCHGVVRIDFLFNTDTQELFVNEVNTTPGSLAFYLWEASGKNFTTLTTELLQLALKRHREKNNRTFSFDSNILSNFQGGLKGGLKGGTYKSK